MWTIYSVYARSSEVDWMVEATECCTTVLYYVNVRNWYYLRCTLAVQGEPTSREWHVYKWTATIYHCLACSDHTIGSTCGRTFRVNNSSFTVSVSY